MIIPDREKTVLMKAPVTPKPAHNRNPDTAELEAKGKALGLTLAAMRSRLKKVEQGLMTLEEAMTTPARSRADAARAVAKRGTGWHKHNKGRFADEGEV